MLIRNYSRLAIVFALALAPLALNAATLNVPDDFETIQAAIDAAEDEDTVLVAAGVYDENLSINGQTITILGDPDDPSQVIIDGGGRSAVVVFSNEEMFSATLSGFTIQNGAQNYGAGIDVQGASAPILTHLIVRQNTSTMWGGGIYGTGTTSSTITDCVLESNEARRGGGLALFNSASAVVTRVIIRDNLASRTNGGDYGDGGGLYVADRATITLDHVAIVDNFAERSCGGVYHSPRHNENYIYRNVTIAGNTADTFGGVLFEGDEDFGGSFQMTNTIISHNTDQQIVWVSGDENSLVSVSYSVLRGDPRGNFFRPDDQRIEWIENLDTDPLFVDPDNGDYRLTANSPCIDTGDPEADPDPDGTRADMGAFYFPHEQEVHLINVPDDFETIQEAIDAAESGDRVLVAPGRYVENIDFQGKDLIIIGSPDDPSQTVIDGNGRGSVVFIEDRVTDAALLSGFTIQNGTGTSYFFGEMFGGGIFIIQSDIVIEHCIIRDNSVDDEFGAPWGGGIVCYGWIEGTHPTIRDCEIFDNTSEGYGGGVAILGSNVTLERVFIHNNIAGRAGGVAVIEECEVTIRNSAICDNHSDNSGGGIEVTVLSTVDLQNVTIAGNVAENIGGGLFCADGILINAVNSILWGNEPQAVAFMNANDPNSIAVSYCDVENGEDGIVVNDNGEVDWGEGNLADDPLFVDPDNGDYHLTVNSPCIDAGDPEAVLDPDGTQADMGAFYFPQNIQRIPLVQGWQTVSSFIQPQRPRMPDVWRDVVSRGHLILVKDQSGHFYNVEWGFNNIPPWDVRQGYQALLTEPDTLVIYGEAAEEDLLIPLAAGWSIVAYFPEAAQLAPAAFSNIVDDLVIAKNARGQFYCPEWEFSNMAPLTRGCGYQVLVSEDCDLVWNVPEGRLLAVEPKRPEERPFVPALPTYCNMSVLLTVTGVADGAQIGAFDSQGVLVGKGEIHSARCGLAVWGDDPDTPEREGLVEGEAFSLKLLGVDGVDVLQGEGLVYQTDGFTVVEAAVRTALPTECYLSEPYPNPFNSTTRLTFGLPEAGWVNLSIYDLSGRLVDVVANGELSTGVHSVYWSAEGLPSGLYLVRLDGGGKSMARRAVLLK